MPLIKEVAPNCPGVGYCVLHYYTQRSRNARFLKDVLNEVKMIYCIQFQPCHTCLFKILHKEMRSVLKPCCIPKSTDHLTKHSCSCSSYKLNSLSPCPPPQETSFSLEIVTDRQTVVVQIWEFSDIFSKNEWHEPVTSGKTDSVCY